MNGQQAPDFALVAVATRREFRLSAHRDRAVLLIFADVNTARQSRDVVVGLRQTYRDLERLVIAVVVDLRVVPSLLRGMAEGIMETAYRGAAAEIPAGYNPADHLILLKDWDGKVSRAYGVGDGSRHLRLVLVDSAGRVASSHAGDHSPEAARRMVADLLGPG